MSTLKENVQRLIDIEDIKILKHRYAKFCDDDYNAVGISNLFVEDGIWDGGILGFAEGREAIAAMFRATPALVEYALHSVSNPIIEISGDEATGHWYLWQPMVIKPDDQALWLIANYKDTYVRVDGEWKFKKLVCTPQALSPYKEGFGKVRFIEVPSQP